jgi:hypothetical protein
MITGWLPYTAKPLYNPAPQDSGLEAEALPRRAVTYEEWALHGKALPRRPRA